MKFDQKAFDRAKLRRELAAFGVVGASRVLAENTDSPSARKGVLEALAEYDASDAELQKVIRCQHGNFPENCETCRGWSEHSRLAHIYGAENV